MDTTIGPYIWQKALPKHYSAIKTLVLGVLKEYGLKHGTVDDCLDDIDLHYFKKGGFFGVLLNNEQQVIATAGLYPIGQQEAEIRKMYLLPSCRGQGLGKYILQDLIQRALKMGFFRLELETASVLKEAISLYKSFGFIPFDSQHLSDRCDQAFELLL
jgi:putative acetyltransferase